jgi:hypothetical protein
LFDDWFWVIQIQNPAEIVASRHMYALEETKKALATIKDRSRLRSSKHSRNNQDGFVTREVFNKGFSQTKERKQSISRQRNRNISQFNSSTVHRGIRSQIRQPNRKTGFGRPRKTNQLARRRNRNITKTKRNRTGTGLRGFSMSNNFNNIQITNTKKFPALLNHLTTNRPKGNVTINRRNEFNTPLPMVSPEGSARNFGQEMGMVVCGSEYMTALTIYTSSSTTIAPTAVGDTLYSIPLCPLFMPGTRLSKFAEMYRKYKFTNFILEFVPDAPTTQNGGLIGYVTHDPDENISTSTSSDAKIREAMARKGAEIWNLMTYGRVHYKDDGTIGWYTTGDANNAESAIAGVINIIADSVYLPFDGTQVSLTVGQLIAHYELHLCDRIFDDNDDNDSGAVIFNTGATAVTETYFTGLTTQDSCASLVTEFALMAGITPTQSDIFMIRVLTGFLSGTTPTTSSLVNTNNGQHRFWGPGSIWYAFCAPNGTDVHVYYTNILSEAMDRNVNATWSTVPGANCSFAIEISRFITDYDD